MTSQYETIGPAAIERAFCACIQVAKAAFAFLGFNPIRQANEDQKKLREQQGIRE